MKSAHAHQSARLRIRLTDEVTPTDLALVVPRQQRVRAKSVSRNKYSVAKVMAIDCCSDNADFRDEMSGRNDIDKCPVLGDLHCG